MNKKLWLGFIATFVVIEVLSFLENGVILMKDYDALSNVWRSDIDSKLYIIHITTLVFSFFFAFIFSKGYENRGMGEGIRYGLYLGLMIWLPAAYNQYAVYPIPYGLTVKWFIMGVVTYMIAGLVLAMIFKGKQQEA